MDVPLNINFCIKSPLATAVVITAMKYTWSVKDEHSVYLQYSQSGMWKEDDEQNQEKLTLRTNLNHTPSTSGT
jgi:hypothetical protein